MFDTAEGFTTDASHPMSRRVSASLRGNVPELLTFPPDGAFSKNSCTSYTHNDLQMLEATKDDQPCRHNAVQS